MAHVAFHLSEEFIVEDLDYYFSGERDKNNQILPDENIHSMTPSSSRLGHTLGDGRVTNFFYPLLPNLVDRIYIGISVPLFSNNWGASFLLQLLKILKPDGSIILPVYPEGQAQEKGYWSRSFLENIFLSRQRWTGFSNVRAENDGVMSLKVGRKWPEPMPSTIEWFYQQRANLVLQNLFESTSQNEVKAIYTDLVKKVWDNYAYSAVVERIILEHYGAMNSVAIHNFSNDCGLLITDLLLSPYISVTSGITTHYTTLGQEVSENNFKAYFSPHVESRHQIQSSSSTELDIQQPSDVICISNRLAGMDATTRKAFLKKVWDQVNPMGILIVYEDLVANSALSATELNDALEQFGVVEKYSTIVASKIQDDIDISHYSTIQESKLVEEKREETKIFRVVHKK